MDIEHSIRAAESDAHRLENFFKEARRAGQETGFAQAIRVLHEEFPENLLYSAWFYRLADDEPAEERTGGRFNWLIAAVISVVNGLVFWWLSGLEISPLLDDRFPYFLILWSPVATASALVFLIIAGKKTFRRSVFVGAILFAAAAYVLLLAAGQATSWLKNDYLMLSFLHLPLLCWAGLGLAELGLKSGVPDRIAFLIKSVEVMVTAGVYLIVGMIFGGITMGMFGALGIELPDLWMRLIIAGGVGLLPVLAVATIYDPAMTPSGQDFSQGLSRFVATMMRLLLPLTLIVLLIYIAFIPFNFFEPFNNRDVLIVFNVMLFGVMGLLLGATPVREAELSPQMQTWLRRGVLGVAALAGLVSVYALAAVIYRTIDGGWTINRLTVIGWNSINIGLLFVLIYRVIRSERIGWIAAQHRVFALATNAYIAWGLFLLIVVPLIFRT